MRLPLVYVAGPYRSDTEWGVIQNIRNAEFWALELWTLGIPAICPHKNTAGFGGACDDTVWLAGDLEMMRRCDAVYAIPGWEDSAGATAEVIEAHAINLPVLTRLDAARQWAAEWRRARGG